MSTTLGQRGGLALLLALVLWLFMLGSGAALAQADPAAAQVERQHTQPLNNAPVWREVDSGKSHFTTVRGPETGVLIQSEGQTWRQWRNGPITFYGGILLLVVPTAIGLFYAVKGAVKLHGAPTGRRMQRFNLFERVVHWGTAISFVVLGITGVCILFGKHVIEPIFGNAALGGLLWAGKGIHNYLGPVFAVFTLLMILAFLRDNVWQAIDSVWIRKAGGIASGEHVPSGRFNFGEKTWFWIGVTFLGLIVAGSGLVMDFPNFGQTRADMQLANIIHGVGAIVLIALSLGHIYMGTIGVEGAYQSMKTGYVDETWAKEHHEHWYDEVKAGRSGHP
ncbi:formate dehydrogenase subunit gamma [Aromatoleum evansii]|uniref:Formate dehydrogenase subunit gamma n=1 Tax=Aromatoleum evansii TaxID=59406 RepID=A0ABZ1AL00_AROEV|nr:formate dehydrogenase subunit gamma [Aromatoleum evansii]NMG28047.1 formate dehydrogenase subunit gamma [Aromatoleum evansii]WRL46544.1 formate dehydrogenase subunit gamma [Aromatoleum evansii]